MEILDEFLLRVERSPEPHPDDKAWGPDMTYVVWLQEFDGENIDTIGTGETPAAALRDATKQIERWERADGEFDDYYRRAGRHPRW